MRTIVVISTEAFAHNIRAIRKYLGWTSDYFCRHFEMEPWMLDRIETGDFRKGFDIYLDSLCTIAKVMDLHKDHLIHRMLFFS